MTWIAAAIGGIGAWAGTAGGAAVIGGALAGGGALLAANTQAGAAENSAKIQGDATNNAANTQRDIYNQQREDLEPWRQAGANALPQLNALANDTHQFGMDDFQQDPGYAFRMSEGLKAIQRSAAARGSLMSGATLKGLDRYSQGLASDEYNNAFNRYQVGRNSRLNQLQALAGIGQTATQQMGQAGENYANNSGNLAIANGNALAQGQQASADARASGYLGVANSLNGALGSYVNYNQNQALLNSMMKPNNGSSYMSNPSYSPAATDSMAPFAF